MRRLTTPLAFAVVLLSSGAANAQVEAADTPSVVLPAVTVTVLRTPIQIGRAPYAVAVNDAERIQRGQPGIGIDETLRGIPGVQVDNRFNHAVGERIAVRGFGARAQFGVRGVRVLVDGIPATLPDGQSALTHIDLRTVERAEVIRGPASALYGNTAGGVIQLETAGPPVQPLGQELGFVTGSHGFLRLHSSTGGTSGGTSYLLNLSHLESAGHREFNRARNQYLGGRIGFESGNDEVRLIFSGVDSDAQNPGSLSRELVEEDRWQAFSNNVRQQTGKVAREGQLGLTWMRRMQSGLNLETVAYGIQREVENPIPTAIIDLGRGAWGARSVLRGSAAPGLDWAVGIEADRQRDERLNFENVTGERGSLTLDQLENVTNLAGYAQLTATPSDRWTLLAGLRYDWFRFSVEDYFIGDGNPDDSGSRTMNALSPSIGVNVRVGDRAWLYGNIATSFETPTTTELANRPDGAGGFNRELEPQQALSFEAGMHGAASRLPVVWQFAAYHTRVSNSLIPYEVPEAAGRQFFRNAGSALHRGFEAAATLTPVRGLRLHGAYTLTDARFVDYETERGRLDGNRVPGVAPHRFDLSASLENRSGWFAILEGRHVARIAVDDANTARSPAYSLLELRLGRSSVPLGSLLISPFVGVTNLLDTRYNTAVAVNAFGGRFYEPGPGRGFHLGARLSI